MNPFLHPPSSSNKNIKKDMNTLLFELSNNHFVMEHVQAQADHNEPHVFTDVSPVKPSSNERVQKEMDRVYGNKQTLTEAERREKLNAQLAFTFVFPPERVKSAAVLEQELSQKMLGRFEGLDAQQKMELTQAHFADEGKDAPIESMAEFDDGLYFAFALAMLETAAHDIEKSQKDMERYKDDPDSPQYQAAKDTFETTHYWLDGGDSPFSLEDCAVLLEQELRLQSLDQVRVPNVTERYEELGQWIKNDPNSAKQMIRSYHSLFSYSCKSDRQFDQLVQSNEDDPDPYWEVDDDDDEDDNDYAPRRMRLR